MRHRARRRVASRCQRQLEVISKKMRIFAVSLSLFLGSLMRTVNSVHLLTLNFSVFSDVHHLKKLVSLELCMLLQLHCSGGPEGSLPQVVLRTISSSVLTVKRLAY